MIGVMVVSHEPLGTALIRCTRHVFGRLPPQLAALDVIPDEDPVAAGQAARELLARINDGSGVVVFTDCWGATPSRIAMELSDPLKVYVLAGVNLPMLLKAITLRRMPVHELVEQLVEAGHRAIRVIEPEQEVDPKARAAR
ncbi:MAG: PTS sugar transporter subunit IIB [Limnobacter sp.]|nr:PTS sugar transporter subunit IIB [Limnobacter sp.]